MAINNEMLSQNENYQMWQRRFSLIVRLNKPATDLKNAILSVENPQLTIKILLQERRFKDKENRDYYSYYDYKDLKNFYDPSIKKMV